VPPVSEIVRQANHAKAGNDNDNGVWNEEDDLEPPRSDLVPVVDALDDELGYPQYKQSADDNQQPTYPGWCHDLAQVLELLQTLQHQRRDMVAGTDCSVTQAVGAGQRRVLQAAEQLADFLLDGVALGAQVVLAGNRVAAVVDLGDQGCGSLDECLTLHGITFFGKTTGS
jgi:hypothetical protein